MNGVGYYRPVYSGKQYVTGHDLKREFLWPLSMNRSRFAMWAGFVSEAVKSSERRRTV